MVSNIWMRWWILTSLILLLSACTSTSTQRQMDAAASGYKPLPIHQSALRLAAEIPADKLTTASRQIAAEGIRALDIRQYSKASDLFNLALKTDINNSYLHFLNGLTYHLRGLDGEATLFALAQQGYERAIQFDGSNAIAHYYLGSLYLDRRDYAAAKGEFMEAALYIKDDPDLLYDLATASYYARDPRTAYAAMNGLLALTDGEIGPRNLRALAITAAAAGDDAAARGFLKQLAERKLSQGQGQLGFVEDRVQSWASIYSGNIIKADYTMGGGMSGGMGSGYGGMNGSMGGLGGIQQAGAFFDKNMVMLDVAIIATEEDDNDTFGVNLLEGLRIQFGNQLGTPGYSRQITQNSDLLNPLFDSATKQITRVIEIPSIAYTLNIANAQDRRNEVLARPSLVALAGQTSTFFSGTDVIGAAVSTGQGGSVQVQKEAGVKLSLLPEFLPDGLIKIQVTAERTFLTNPNSNVLFDFRLDTSKTIVNANVAMKFGETLILSGLSERNIEVDNSGVPGLRDVPLVQYLFSRQTKRDFHKSVLILITPRRPSYTNRDDRDIAAERENFSDFERAQAEFEDKYKLWFQPVPNVAQAVSMLEYSPVFREFRSGDIKLDSWISRASHGGRLRAALGFLYY